MPYLVERQQALRTQEIVAILTGQQRRFRSHVILRDNSLVKTLTRPKTLTRVLAEARPPDNPSVGDDKTKTARKRPRIIMYQSMVQSWGAPWRRRW